MVRVEIARPRQDRPFARLGAALAVAAAAFALSPSPLAAAEDALLSGLAGEWVGNGSVQLGPKAAPERVYCRIVSALVGGNSISQKGRCSVASNSGALDGTISAKGSGRYEGVLDAPSVGAVTFKGVGSGGKLTLSANFVDSKTQQQRRATITLSLSGSAYRLVTNNAGDDGTYVASDIVFRKQ